MRISQQELAKELGVASNTVSRWETGTSKPRLDDLDRIARTLGLGVGDLLPQNSTVANENLGRLMRTLEGLPKEDLVEVERYAEYRRLRGHTKEN